MIIRIALGVELMLENHAIVLEMVETVQGAERCSFSTRCIMPVARLSAETTRNLARRYPLLATKFYVSQPMPENVSRWHLIEQLNRESQRPLTIIAAPAGFGKTSLLSAWIYRHSWTFAWISLDSQDNDPVRFWFHVAAAFQALLPTLDEATLAAFSPPDLISAESALMGLLNEIIALEANVGLILDDYHVIDTPAIHNALTFLIDHLPPQAHLVIASRTEPPLPLTRWRARNQLFELHAADLRFSFDETREFFQKTVRVPLAQAQLERLDEHVEGWVAGLRLVALSMQHHGDLDPFIAAITGETRFIGEYLTSEVLRQQPPDVCEFLLHTSILTRLNASLCNALTGREDAGDHLKLLETNNLFLIPQDDQRQWYRYHHLFADFLYRQLSGTSPEVIPDLHRRAAAWYEYNGLMEDAIYHALAGQDYDRATDLITRIGPNLLQRAELTVLIQWLAAIPDAQFDSSPDLAFLYAQVLTISTQYERADAYLRRAEQRLRAAIEKETTSTGTEVAEKTQLLGAVIGARAMIASTRGNIQQTLMLAQQALEYRPAGDDAWRSTLTFGVGVAQVMSGNTTDACETMSKAIDLAHAAQNSIVELSACFNLGDAVWRLGQLSRAEQAFQDALHVMPDRKRTPPSAGWAHIGLGDILYERNDLDTATHHLEIGIDLAVSLDLKGALVRGYATLAQILAIQDDWDQAMATLDKAKQLTDVSYINPEDRWCIPATEAGLWLAQGNLESARHWEQIYRLSLDDEPKFPDAAAYLMLARILVAQQQPERAVPVLDRVIAAEQAAGRLRLVITGLALKALALDMQGDQTAAFRTLDQAFVFGQPEQFRRTFVDNLPDSFLQRAALRGIEPDYIAVLLGSAPAVSEPSPVLSERELEILRLLAAGMSSKEIADTLVIAFHTARTHVKNIYGKLEAHNRIEAVDRARSLGLLK